MDIQTSTASDGGPSSFLARAGWTALNFAQFAFTLAWSVLCISAALLVLALSRRRELPLRMAARLWAPGLLWGAGARVEVRGAERVDWSQPQVVVANHQSVIDICALFRALPVPLHFVIKQELKHVPFLGWYARAMGMVFIARGRTRDAARLTADAAGLVRDGATLCVFAEGTRSRDGRVAPFKRGAFQIAAEAGAPVLPVAISGSGKVLSPNGFFRVRGGRIVVAVGTPIPTAGATVDRQALAEAARAAIVDTLRAVEAERG